MANEEYVEKLVKAGGSRWQKGNMDRVYFNGLSRWYGLECSYYNSGNIAGASLNGEKVSNGLAFQIQSRLADARVWYDSADNMFHGKAIEQADFDVVIAAIKGALAQAEAA